MYGKNVNAYLVSHPSLHHLNGGEFLLHHHHDLLSGNNNNNYLAATIAAASNAPTILESTALFSNQEIGGCGPVGTGIILNGEYTSTAAPPPPAKKDRHSKIQTSQGPRDRRVRLSISIARKFFDLQEMLGFDKPSKTLDWLLTKSKAAIKDLVQTKKNAGTSCSEPDVGSQENGSKRKSSASPALNLAKESRVRARARARERTREKMCMKKINEAINHTGFGLGPRPENNSPIQYLHNNHFFEANYEEAEAASAGDDHHQDLIQGTNILIKRRIKNPSFLGFQPNYSTSFPSENWDISSFNSYSNISAIFDQHKFMNSNSNDN